MPPIGGVGQERLASATLARTRRERPDSGTPSVRAVSVGEVLPGQDRDLLHLGLPLLRERDVHREHAVRQVGVHLVRVDILGEREPAGPRAAPSLPD